MIICLFAACTDSITDGWTDSMDKKPITFTSLRHKVITRYANDNHSNYQIYGFTEGENSKGWSINSVVSPGAGTDGSDYIHNGSYFWPGNNKNVLFYAYSPDTVISGIKSVITDAATPSIDITYQVTDSAQTDFTIAIPLTLDSGNVNLQFQHMLSKIIVNAKLSDDLTNAGYTLNSNYKTSLQVAYDINTINAVYDYSDTNKLSSWSSSPQSSSSDSQIYYECANSYLIMPQTFTATSIDTSDDATIWGNCTVKLTNVVITLVTNNISTIIFSGDLQQYGFADGVITNNTFLPNQCYLLNFTITEDRKSVV